MKLDLSVAQLLCSRLCHDLVGPVGAISTGLELLEDGMAAEGDGDGEDAALGLMAKSAAEAARRLAFFRVAFGLAGGASGSATAAEAQGLAAGFLEGGKVVLDWPLDAPPPDGPLSPTAAKVLLSMVLIAAESLPRGGRVGVRLAGVDDGLGVAVTATGDGAGIKDDMAAALEPNVAASALTVRNVHGHFAQSLARTAGAAIEHSEGADGEIRLAALFPIGPNQG